MVLVSDLRDEGFWGESGFEVWIWRGGLVSLVGMWLTMMTFRLWRRSLDLTCEKGDIFGLDISDR